MDGCTGFKTSTSEELPDAVAVMDPLQVVRLAATPRTTAGAASSRTHTFTEAARATPSPAPAKPCTPARARPQHRQRQRLTALLGVEEHVQVEATWGIDQRRTGAYRDPTVPRASSS